LHFKHWGLYSFAGTSVLNLGFEPKLNLNAKVQFSASAEIDFGLRATS